MEPAVGLVGGLGSKEGDDDADGRREAGDLDAVDDGLFVQGLGEDRHVVFQGEGTARIGDKAVEDDHQQRYHLKQEGHHEEGQQHQQIEVLSVVFHVLYHPSIPGLV